MCDVIQLIGKPFETVHNATMLQEILYSRNRSNIIYTNLETTSHRAYKINFKNIHLQIHEFPRRYDTIILATDKEYVSPFINDPFIYKTHQIQDPEILNTRPNMESLADKVIDNLNE